MKRLILALSLAVAALSGCAQTAHEFGQGHDVIALRDIGHLPLEHFGSHGVAVGIIVFAAVHDASVRYRADDWSVVVGISNVFDEHPPTVSSDGPSTGTFGRQGNAVATGGPYDLLGRRGFLSVSKEF